MMMRVTIAEMAMMETMRRDLERVSVASADEVSSKINKIAKTATTKTEAMAVKTKMLTKFLVTLLL